MAKDIVQLDPWEDKCPWCKKPILVGHQLVFYEDSESEQFVGLKKDEKRGGLEMATSIYQKVLESIRQQCWDAPNLAFNGLGVVFLVDTELLKARQRAELRELGDKAIITYIEDPEHLWTDKPKRRKNETI